MVFHQILRSLLLSIDQVGVVPWCLIWWFVWFNFHFLYKTLFEVLLKKIGIDESRSPSLIFIYWDIAFTSITIPFAMLNLNISCEDVRDTFCYVLENNLSSWLSSKPTPSLQIKLSYVILAGYYVNSVFETSLEKGVYSKEFLMKECVALFFLSTFPLRCIQYGLLVTSAMNLVQFFYEISCLFCCFCDIAHSQCIRGISLVFYFFYFLAWLTVYFNLFPRYFIYFSLKQIKFDGDARLLILFFLLNLSLTAIFVGQLFTADVSHLLLGFMKGKHILSSDDTILQNDTNIIDCHPVEVEKRESKEENENKTTEKCQNEDLWRKQKKRQNLLRLYHTVKCAIRIKRKLSRIRNKLHSESYFDQIGLSEETEDNYMNEEMERNARSSD